MAQLSTFVPSAQFGKSQAGIPEECETEPRTFIAKGIRYCYQPEHTPLNLPPRNTPLKYRKTIFTIAKMLGPFKEKAQTEHKGNRN